MSNSKPHLLHCEDGGSKSYKTLVSHHITTWHHNPRGNMKLLGYSSCELLENELHIPGVMWHAVPKCAFEWEQQSKWKVMNECKIKLSPHNPDVWFTHASVGSQAFLFHFPFFETSFLKEQQPKNAYCSFIITMLIIKVNVSMY